ncbi:MAG: shikimate dehydrogenase [Asticcacaulis sp.]
MSYLTGLFGRGIGASKSGLIHERESRNLGLSLVYRLIDFDALKLGDEALPDMLAAAVRLGYQGLNITYPFKQKIIPYLDDLSEEAQLLGAVNAVVIRDGRLTGHNTDWYGFAQSLRLALPSEPLGSVLQLGAGGAGSAVAYALLRSGVECLYLSDPDVTKRDEIIRRFADAFPDQRIVACETPQSVVPLVNGVVQASPIGMAHHPGVPMDTSGLNATQWVVDIIYFPAQTEFLKKAADKGCRTFNGEGMVVYQAAEGFRLFTGIVPDDARMLREFSQPAPDR